MRNTFRVFIFIIALIAARQFLPISLFGHSGVGRAITTGLIGLGAVLLAEIPRGLEALVQFNDAQREEWARDDERKRKT